jgi:hypothetical protein
LDSGSSGLEYLEQFFGRDRKRFSVIGGAGYTVQPNPSGATSLAQFSNELAAFAQTVSSGGISSLQSATMSLASSVNLPNLSKSTEEILNDFLIVRNDVTLPPLNHLKLPPNHKVNL